MNSRCLVAMLLTLLLAPHIAGAQARTLEPGNRIRVTLPVEKKAAFGRMNARRVGSLVEVTTDSLTILTETGTPLKLPLSGVERLDVSLGTTRMIQRGALTGGAFGGALVGIIAAVGTSDRSNACPPEEWCLGFQFDVSPGVAFTAGFLMGMLPGAAIGALAGTAIRADKWAEVPLPSGLRITPLIGFRDAGIRLTF